ncbi:hypothetical protein CMMCAS08_16140 [Clavibacter michiganensis subsp. michiganensis]|nr:hypothetical protein CMMCAS08_16140 [Clavibacter michiganensis subsp. michiganensis]
MTPPPNAFTAVFGTTVVRTAKGAWWCATTGWWAGAWAWAAAGTARVATRASAATAAGRRSEEGMTDMGFSLSGGSPRRSPGTGCARTLGARDPDRRLSVPSRADLGMIRPRRALSPTRARRPTGWSDAARDERTCQLVGQELVDALMAPPTFGAGQMSFA